MFKQILFFIALCLAVTTQAATPTISFQEAKVVKKQLDDYVNQRSQDQDLTINETTDSSGIKNRYVSYPLDIETAQKLEEQNNSQPYFGEGGVVTNTGYQNSISYQQKWGDENYGASIDVAYTVEGTKDILSSHSWFKGNGYIKDTSLSLIEFDQQSHNDAASNMYLSVLGNKVWSKSGYIIRESPSFDRKYEKNYEYSFGPLSFTVNGDIGGNVGAEISADTMRGAKLLNIVVRPHTDVYANASVVASAYIVSADITGKLQVLNSSLPAKTYLQWLPKDTKLIVGYYVNGNVDTMTGDLSLNAYVNLAPWYSDSWTWPLYTSPGYHNQWDIANDQYVLNL
jgi:hypothetical protein